jgi:hypothetical protein
MMAADEDFIEAKAHGQDKPSAGYIEVFGSG